jgi:beta-lactamase regulating signal transducer with metallopeptidase domain
VAIKLLIMPFWTYAIFRAQATPNVPEREPVGSSGQATAALDTLSAEPSPESPAAVRKTASVKPSPQVPDVPRTVSSWSRITWIGWLLGLWGVVVAGQCLRILWQHRRLARLLREATGADATLSALVGETAGRLGLRRAPQAVLTDVDCSPFVCGVRRTVLVLPRGLMLTLSTTELNHVLLHELAHVRRLDLVWGWIGELARMAYFFHPVVHWIVYQIRLERELACDQLAMATSGRPAAEYAATLVRVVSQASEPSVFKTSAASAGLDGESA